MRTHHMSFVPRIIAALNDRGVRHTDIASDLGKSRSTVSRWAEGDVEPRLKDFEALRDYALRKLEAAPQVQQA